MSTIDYDKLLQGAESTKPEVRWEMWNRILNCIRRAYDKPVVPPEQNPFRK